MVQLSRWRVAMVVIAAVLGLLFSLPNALPASMRASLPGFVPKQTLALGLDLQGGSYLLLEVDVAALQRERLTNLQEDVRNVLREEGVGFTGLTRDATGVSFALSNAAQLQAAREALRPLTQPGVTGRADFALASAGDGRLRIAFTPEALRSLGVRAVDQSIEIVRRRVDSLGNREASITRQGQTRIVVQVPGQSDPEALKRVIGQTAKLSFHMVDGTVPLQEAAAGLLPPGRDLLTDEFGQQIVIERRSFVTGENLTQVNVSTDELQRPAIAFRFDGAGTRRMASITANNIGRRFAIVLDGQVISAPEIRGAIPSGSGQITGSFTVESANELVQLLRGGSLPAPLTVEEQRTVGAELGQDAIDAGLTSTVIGMIFVVAFMLLAYGLLFGGISIVALAVNGLLIVGIMSLFQATLTLPGIAGLILTLAVAVDANVLIYERMRDEVRAGRPPLASMEAGFSRAVATIIDANLTNLFAALIMFFLGAGPVKGFAWTLTIGVFTSVFTAVFVTQVLLAWWFRAFRPKTLPIA
jgi:protein-export membrane protein SecD